ncbi:hypothetical protein COHA_010352 [Chlorella ohadii]|uniref:DNA-binding protein RHL1 n=1 Tax=Chlorella ohadii TaxID=2649997 RepID=A0AAD5H1C0_9CHLO|nr:hypothetical protein COHA_010352 [Chlorella ohadii]
MAPKAQAAASAAAAEDPSLVEHQRLQEAAFDMGVLSHTRRLCTQPLPPTKVMQRAGGKDIVKKSSSRKGRYLLAFNFQLAPAAAGKLGTLAALDSKNPVMYLDFPQGRYKLFGTLVFPRNKYLVLRMGQKEVLCEDVLESMIVFSEGWWVGTAEENPEERRLPEPDWLAQPPLHSKFDFSTRGTAAAAPGATGKDTEAAEEEEEEAEEEPASQRPQRRASRGAAGKRLRYNEASSGEEDGAQDSEAEERAPRKLQRTGSQQQRAQRTTQAKQQPESHPIDLVENGSSEDDERPLAARAGKPAQATLDAFVKRQAAAAPKSAGKAAAAKAKPARKRAAAADSDTEDKVVDLAGSSGDEAAAAAGTQEPPSSQRPRSQRKAAGAASKKLRIEENSEDEEAEDGGDAVSDDDPIEDASGSKAVSGSEEEEEASEEEASDYVPSD